MNRKISLLVTFVLVLAFLVGCGNGAANTTTGGATATKAPATSAAAAATTAPAQTSNLNDIGTLPIVKDKITLSVMQYIRDTDPITMEGLWYATKIEEDTNIHIDYQQETAADWNTKINLTFASGNYPDLIINGGTIDSEIYGVDQGIVLPVDDLIAQYMPVYQSRLALDAQAPQSLVKTDGKMYAIGCIADYGSNCNGEFFINQKWLTELGLATPTNTDELYAALQAFVASEPGRIGYEGIFDELTTYFFFLWGIPENDKHFYIDDDRKVQFAPFQDGYRQAVEYIASMYKDGLMDPATLTQDGNARIATYNQNNIGLSTMHRLKSMGWDILEQDMVHLMPPAAPGYNVKFFSSFSVASERVFFTKTNKYLAESACWVDYQLQDQPTFESFYGPEGTLWDWNAEGKCELGPAGDQGVFEYALGVCGIYYMPSVYYNEVYKQPPYRQERIDYCKMYADAGYIQKYANNYARNLAKIPADTQTKINQNFANIEALYDEKISEMILHGVTDAKWNEFLAQLKSAGAEEYIGYYQTAIDEYFAN